jgi:hypothetical protein
MCESVSIEAGKSGGTLAKRQQEIRDCSVLWKRPPLKSWRQPNETTRRLPRKPWN